MKRQRIDPNLSGFKADRCLFCDRTDRPLRIAGGVVGSNRMVCTPCSHIWWALPHPEEINTTYRMVEWRDVIVAAQAHGASAQQIAQALLTLGIFN
jgi:hypothetical protein